MYYGVIERTDSYQFFFNNLVLRIEMDYPKTLPGNVSLVGLLFSFH